MANATSAVKQYSHPFTDTKIRRNLATTAQTYYPGEMIAVDASDNATKCDDTAGLLFDGINVEANRIEVESGGSAGGRTVLVDKPFRFSMTIASASAGDIGKKVYAKYSNEVAYTSTNSVLVGVVEKVLSSTLVLIRPWWVNTSGASNFDGEVLTFDGATTVNQILMPDNLADALSVLEGSNAYLTFVTTNSSERVVLKKQTKLADSVKLAFGDADDITLAWDGTDFDVLQATANSSIKWGVDGAGIDQVWYGDTASTDMTWDQSADSLIFTGQAYVEGNKMKTVANTDGSLTIDATHSGKMITTRGASGATTITLPTVAAGFTGVHFWVFNCVDQDLTLSAQTAGQIMFKHDTAADSVAYATSSEKIGGGFFVHCDGTSWLVMPLAEEAQTITVT